MRRPTLVLKNLISIAALACLTAAAIPTIIFAQQETREIAPETRNPQAITPPRLFKHNESNLQPSGTEQILTQSLEIEIPSGKPAQPVPAAPGPGYRLSLIAATILGIAASTYLFRRSSTIETDSKPAKSVVPPQAVVEEAPVKKAAFPKKKSSSKKNNTRKKRKKR